MLLRETLWALAEPRRLVPLALVATSLLGSEWVATGSVRAVLLDLLLVLAFVVTSPALHRLLSSDDDAPWTRQLAGWVLQGLAASFVVGVVAVLVPPLFGVRWTYVSEPRSLGVLVVLFVVGGWGLGRDIELSLGVARERARAERLTIEAEHAQLLALRAQLDPHFLFNTLNAIAEWCREDPIVAENATLKLASILRAILDALHSPVGTLGRELAILEQLAELYAVRDAVRYVFRFDVEEDARRVEMPPLLLLPLFENAIKHGPAAGHTGTVSLVARSTPERTTIEIRNPGAFTGRRDGGHGVSMVERRLVLAYDAGAALTIEARGDETLATVQLPATQRDPSASAPRSGA